MNLSIQPHSLTEPTEEAAAAFIEIKCSMSIKSQERPSTYTKVRNQEFYFLLVK